MSEGKSSPAWLLVTMDRSHARLKQRECPSVGGSRSGAMGAHLRPCERDLVRNEAREGVPVASILKKLAAARRREGLRPVARATVFRFLRGETHQEGQCERRGRKAALSRRAVLRRELSLSGGLGHAWVVAGCLGPIVVIGWARAGMRVVGLCLGGVGRTFSQTLVFSVRGVHCR